MVSDVMQAYCDKTGGYEILAQMMDVDPDSKEIELRPRSRQEIIKRVDASERRIDDRLKQGAEALEILKAECGHKYDQYNDLRRVYRIVPGVLPREMLREIKIKGYYRANQQSDVVVHADCRGGSSRFSSLPDWDTFVDDFS